MSFLCPRCRAGLFDAAPKERPEVQEFLCPRCRAGLFDGIFLVVVALAVRFYALDVGRGFSTLPRASSSVSSARTFLCPRCRAGLFDPPRSRDEGEDELDGVSMPSMSGGAFRRRDLHYHRRWRLRFYALDVGRGFSTGEHHLRGAVRGRFLCPRCRAGLFDGCGLEGLVTCGFVSGCANRSADVGTNWNKLGMACMAGR
jgi:Zn-finger nucleic acid-binding protein